MLNRKSRIICIRVSQEEYTELCARGKVSGAPSLSEHMRSLLFGDLPAREPESGAVVDDRLGYLASHVQELNSRFEQLSAFVGLPEAR